MPSPRTATQPPEDTRPTATLRAGVEAALRAASSAPSVSMHAPHTLAVIDVGSSSVRMSCVRIEVDGSWTPLADEREMTRLAEHPGLARKDSLAPLANPPTLEGEFASSTHTLTDVAMHRSAEAIARFAAIARGFGAEPYCVATAAVRSALNQAAFLALVQRVAGVHLLVLSTGDEARASFDAAAREAPIALGPSAVLDIGGGSLQLTQALHGIVIDRTSLPLGAIALTQRVQEEAGEGSEGKNGEHKPALSGARECRIAASLCDEVISRTITPRVRGTKQLPLHVLGVGGTLTTLLAMVAQRRGLRIDRRDAKQAALVGVVSMQELDACIQSLAALPASRRDEVPGVSGDRSDIILCGLVAAHRALAHIGASHLRIIAGGVREGLLARLAAGRELSFDPLHASSHTSLLAHAGALLDSCAPHAPHAMAPHARHVAHLSMRLFSSLAELLGWRELGDASLVQQRLLLHAGALVHDVGVMVRYKQHHKHSARIVRGCSWPGASAADQAIVALLARYHRRAHPKERHEAYMQLSASQRALVVRLASVLRIADGLDRTHTQRITDARALRAGTTLTIEAVPASGFAGTLTAELAAASDKSGLLEELVGCDVVVR